MDFIKQTFCDSPASRSDLDLEYVDRVELIPTKNESMHTICNLEKNSSLKTVVGEGLVHDCREYPVLTSGKTHIPLTLYLST